MKPLTPRQRLFVAEYLVDHNATQAAVRAGYSAKTAEQQGSRLLTHPGVKAAVDEALAKQEKRLELKADDVLRELGRLALSDIGDGFDAQGKLLALKDMPLDFRRAISSIETDEILAGRGDSAVSIGVTRKVRLWEKPKALELLGKYFKMWVERQLVEPGEGWAELVQGAMQPKPPAGGGK